MFRMAGGFLAGWRLPGGVKLRLAEPTVYDLDCWLCASTELEIDCECEPPQAARAA